MYCIVVLLCNVYIDDMTCICNITFIIDKNTCIDMCGHIHKHNQHYTTTHATRYDMTQH